MEREQLDERGVLGIDWLAAMALDNRQQSGAEPPNGIGGCRCRRRRRPARFGVIPQRGDGFGIDPGAGRLGVNRFIKDIERTRAPPRRMAVILRIYLAQDLRIIWRAAASK